MIGTGIGLALLLSLLGFPSIEGAKDMRVVFQSGAPNGPETRGVACLRSFRQVEGNVQHLCDGLPDRTILIYHEVLAGPEYGDNFRYYLADTLGHEAEHLRTGPNMNGTNLWEQNREGRAYLIGQNYAWEMVRQDKAARGGK